MDKFNFGNLLVTSNPHIRSTVNTQRIMACVILALMPALIASTVIFGFRAILLTVVCVAACIIFEWLFDKITKRPVTVGDLSAVVTGVILAMNLPVTLPFWIAVVGCFVAIVIVKQLFGGLGQNFANPAITARIVLFISFATSMTNWADPAAGRIHLSTADAVTSATPLGVMNESGIQAAEQAFSLKQMLLGTTGGSMGEVCALALLIGGLFLIVARIISPATPVAFLGTIAILALLAGANPIWQICADGAMLGAFFMATDYATTPTTTSGKIIFGIGCGLITMLIRIFGSYPEGVSFSILLMNLLTPHIDSFCEKRLYGNPDKEAKKAEKAARAAAKKEGGAA